MTSITKRSIGCLFTSTKIYLTDLGRSSLPILKSLHHWGDTKKRTINKVIEKNCA